MCAVEVCDRPAFAKGYCSGHYKRLQTGGDLTTPLRGYGSAYVGPWGPWYINDKGYVMRTRWNAGRREYQWEHRNVFAEELGRPLTREENVHHINGIRSDNRRENLELWVTKQPKGKRVEDLVVFAREILELYA